MRLTPEQPRSRAPLRRLRWLAALIWATVGASALANDLPEYRLKAAFIYNFALFTEWPADTGSTINLCIYGGDPFGKDIDELQGKPAGARTISLQRRAATEPLTGCQMVYFSSSVMGNLNKALESLRGQPVLTLADSAGAGSQVILNMAVVQNKISFQANLRAARAARLNLSSKLLRLATEVQQ